MLTHFLELGLDPGTSASDIRERYLELVRRFPPARDPERFRRIARAYEMLSDERAVLRTRLLGALAWSDWGVALDDLVAAGAGRRSSPGLRELLRAAGVLDV